MGKKPDVAPGESPSGSFLLKDTKDTYWTAVVVFVHRSFPRCAALKKHGRLAVPRSHGSGVPLLSELKGPRQGPLDVGRKGVGLQDGTPRLLEGVQLGAVSSSQDLALLVVP